MFALAETITALSCFVCSDLQSYLPIALSSYFAMLLITICANVKYLREEVGREDEGLSGALDAAEDITSLSLLFVASSGVAVLRACPDGRFISLA